ncbi:hypothetical protein Tco_0475681, partial [Tanacetum coccineum]
MGLLPSLKLLSPNYVFFFVYAVFKFATVGAPPLLSATTITTGPPTEDSVMHLPEEAILGGPVYMRWMSTFEVPDEEGANFIGEDDVVPHILEDDHQDDDAHDDAVDPPSQPDYQLPSRLSKMACIAPRSHDEDAGGDPPDDRQPRMLPHQCEGSGKRGESKCKALKKAFKQNGYRKLEMVFEVKDQNTFKPVGRYGANFSSFVGELIKEIPHYYDSWEKVPPSDKAPFIPRLQ